MAPLGPGRGSVRVRQRDLVHGDAECIGDGAQVRQLRARTSGFPAKDGGRGHVHHNVRNPDRSVRSWSARSSPLRSSLRHRSSPRSCSGCVRNRCNRRSSRRRRFGKSALVIFRQRSADSALAYETKRCIGCLTAEATEISRFWSGTNLVSRLVMSIPIPRREPRPWGRSR
jgi:hypothetical protein